MFSITKNGKPLDENLYVINMKNKTFYTEESDLVLNFNDSNWFFDVANDCKFTTGGDCIFKTSENCIFLCDKKCVCTRKDVFEIIIIPKNEKIKLNKEGIKGYKKCSI